MKMRFVLSAGLFFSAVNTQAMLSLARRAFATVVSQYAPVLRRTIKGSGAVCAVGCSPDGRTLTLGHDNRIVFSEVDTGKGVFFDENDTHGGVKVVSPDGKFVLSVYERPDRGLEWPGAVRIFSAEGHVGGLSQEYVYGFPSRACAFAWSLDNYDFGAVSQTGKIGWFGHFSAGRDGCGGSGFRSRWRGESSEFFGRAKQNGRFQPYGNVVLVGEGCARESLFIHACGSVLYVLNPYESPIFKGACHTGVTQISALGISGDGKYLFAGGAGGLVQMLDLGRLGYVEDALVYSPAVALFGAAVRQIVCVGDMLVALVVGSDNSVRVIHIPDVFDVPSYGYMHVLTEASDKVVINTVLSKNGQHIVVCYQDGTVKLWSYPRDVVTCGFALLKQSVSLDRQSGCFSSSADRLVYRIDAAGREAQ